MGASLQYYIWFYINKAVGYSILSNPYELIGLILILTGLVLVGILAGVLYKSYRQTKMKPTLYFFLAFVFFIIAAFFLFLEKLSYASMGSMLLGDISMILSMVTVGIAIIFIDLFAFHNTYPDHVRSLGSIIVIITCITFGIRLWGLYVGPPIMDIINFEIVYLDLGVNIILYGTIIPVIVIGPLTFYYFSIKSYKENKPNSIRSFWFGTGLLCFGVGYIAEVAPFFPTEFSILFRSTYIISAIILYICFTMPDWFKDKIGWTE